MDKLKIESEKVLKQIQHFYQSEEYHALKALSERKTILDIFKKSRSETVHSSMLAWCFENDEFQREDESPIFFLLRLLAINAESQKDTYLNGNITTQGRKRFFENDELWESIVSNSLKVKVDNVHTEENTDGKKKGRIDIIILCSRDKGKKIRICIENKVNIKEHDDQCDNYFSFYSKDKQIENIFVYLAPKYPQELSSNNFVCITYQELLDNVLYPMLKYKEYYSDQSNFYLKEYIRTITSIKGQIILAMGREYKKILEMFFKNNSELIYAAIDAVGDNEIKEKVQEIRKGLTKYQLTIESKTAQLIIGHTKLALTIAEYLAKKFTKDELLNKFGKLDNVKATSYKDYLVACPIKDSKERTHKKIIKSKDHKDVYCSNQWVPDKVEALKNLLEENGIDIIIE